MPRALPIVLVMLASLAAGSTLSVAGEAGPLEVITRRAESANDTRNVYVETLLARAFEKAGRNVRIVQARHAFTRDRLLQELVAGKNIHVSADAPKPEWEEQLLPIRIPIRKGIQGYRLFLINKQDQEALAKVETLEDLLKFPTGSGSQWSIRPLLEKAGFNVVTAEDYETLFEMLRFGRFVTFGRGINEIYSEQALFGSRNENLVVEQTLCLYVPLPTYFFVSPTHPDLARALETGLKRMIADGSFDELFMQFYGDDIDRAELGKRKILKIPNPGLSEQTPLDTPSYWYDPVSLSESHRENRS